MAMSIAQHLEPARGVRVVDKLPDEVCRILVKEGRSMTFLPTDEEPDEPDASSFLKARNVEVKAEDLFSVPLTERFLARSRLLNVVAEEPVTCPHLQRRRWPFSTAGKVGFVRYLEEQEKLQELPAWVRLMDEIERRTAGPVEGAVTIGGAA